MSSVENRKTIPNFRYSRSSINETQIIEKWKQVHDWLEKNSSRYLNAGEWKEAARAAKKLHKFLTDLGPWIRGDPGVPVVSVELADGRKWKGKVTDFVVENLVPISLWLSLKESHKGRPPKAAVICCAEELAMYYEATTDSPKWEKVGKTILDNFPGVLDQANGADPRLWVYKLVKRNREREIKLRRKAGTRRVG